MQTKQQPYEVPEEMREPEMFVQLAAGHGDTILGLTNRGRAFVRMRDNKYTGGFSPPMRWYEIKAPDFNAEFEAHRP